MLLAASALLALVAAVVPGPPPAGWLAGLAAAHLLAAASLVLLPWHAWSPWSPLVIAVPVLGLILTAGAAAEDLGVYAPFLVLLYVWIGFQLPQGAAALVAPLVLVGYAVPLAEHAPTAEAWGVAGVAVAAYTVAAETLSWWATGLRDSERFARRRATALALVAVENARIAALPAGDVLGETTRSLGLLGLESAAAYLPPTAGDPDGEWQPVGSALAVTAADARLLDQVRTDGRTLWTDPGVRAGLLLMATPVRVGDQVAGVLVAEVDGDTRPDPVAVELIEILAGQAGRGLEAAQRVDGADPGAVTDPLTGVGNRRAAELAIEALRPGDTVAVLDLDHFERVIDDLGQAGADAVLVGLASFLREEVRGVDRVTRVGGVEFVLFLASTPLHQALGVVDRLREHWSARGPATTFSAGVATHGSDEEPRAAVVRADHALYEAKRAGRNQVLAAPS